MAGKKVKVEIDDVEIDEEETVSVDGIENSEHILDILQEIDMLKNNISDNSDLGISIYNLQKKNEGLSDDILDAMQLACEKIIEIEKTANELTQIQSKVDMKNEGQLKIILVKMKELEEKSKKVLESILN